MKIAIGADHAGFALKQELKAKLLDLGYSVEDYGTQSDASTDYPDYASAVGHAVSQGRADRGILVCSTGVGMSIAANKIAGVRAALAMNEDEVALTRGHNDANVLTIGAKYVSLDEAVHLVNVFITTPFEGGRHQRRVDKITALEAEAMAEEAGER